MKRFVSVVAALLCLALAFGAVGCSTKDTVPPSTPTAISATTPCNDSTPTFIWDAATDADSGIHHYLVGVDSGDWIDAVDDTSYTLTVAVSDGGHTFRVKAVDKAGNEGTRGNLDFTCDTVATTISSVTVSGTSSSTKITWTTNESTTSQVEYGSTTSYGSSSTLNSSLVTTHSVTLTGLTSATYHYRVKSRDACGNEAQSGDYTFTTYEDAEFESWGRTTGSQIGRYLADAQNAASSYNWSSLESICQTEQTLIDQWYIPQCQSFHLSAKWEAVRSEYRAYLDDHSLAAYHCKLAGMYLSGDNVEDIEPGLDNLQQGTSYLEQANAHSRRCVELILEAKS